MLKLDLYINAVGFISHCGNSLQGNTAFSEQLIEPDYNQYIPPMQQRRMSKAVRMGVGAAKMCLEKSKIQPEAIHVGTALGCLNDTEFFLKKMVEQDEQMLTPTSFIQSTHNTVAGQIALQTNCKGHNLTFVHRAFSFGHALLDAQLYLYQHPNAQVLVGAVDEKTPLSSTLMNQTGREMNAEGAAFFMISGKQSTESLAHLQSIQLSTEVINPSEDYPLITPKILKDKCGSMPTADAIGLAYHLMEKKGVWQQLHSFCDFYSLLQWKNL